MPENLVLLDTVAVACALGISPGLVRLWAHRGLLERRGTDARRRALYDLGRAYRVQAQRRQRAKGPCARTVPTGAAETVLTDRANTLASPG